MVVGNTSGTELNSVRSKKTKEDFVKYLEEHPDERFWQAVRNFSGAPFVVVRNSLPTPEESDTFYREEL